MNTQTFDPHQFSVDTLTPEGFREGRKILKLERLALAKVLNVSESAVRRWESGDRPINPTAAQMLNWLLDGFWPLEFGMSGRKLAAAREKLGLTQDQLAEVLDVETELFAKWESDDRGPPIIVARAVWWLASGLRPDGFPTA